MKSEGWISELNFLRIYFMVSPLTASGIPYYGFRLAQSTSERRRVIPVCVVTKYPSSLDAPPHYKVQRAGIGESWLPGHKLSIIPFKARLQAASTPTCPLSTLKPPPGSSFYAHRPFVHAMLESRLGRSI